MRLEVTGNRLVVQARAKEATEWTRLVIEDARITGKGINIGINRNYLLTRATSSCSQTPVWAA